MNEEGVYGGLLYMPGFCDDTPADGTDRATLLAPADMVTFVLQTCSSVAEVREATMSVTVWPSVVPAMGIAPPLHLVCPRLFWRLGRVRVARRRDGGVRHPDFRGDDELAGASSRTGGALGQPVGR
jgi:hypothetical protein